jgi:hypothetical protein
MPRVAKGHVEQLPSGSWRARVYAGIDPITQREIRFKATEAAQHFAAENADREARAEYAARLEREAYAEPEPAAQAQASYEADIEL